MSIVKPPEARDTHAGGSSMQLTAAVGWTPCQWPQAQMQNGVMCTSHHHTHPARVLGLINGQHPVAAAQQRSPASPDSCRPLGITWSQQPASLPGCQPCSMSSTISILWPRDEHPARSPWEPKCFCSPLKTAPQSSYDCFIWYDTTSHSSPGPGASAEALEDHLGLLSHYQTLTLLL